MNCYYHQENHAVGICTSCYRGVCQNCVCTEGEGVSCNNLICIARTKKIWQIINTNTEYNETIVEILAPFKKGITPAEIGQIIIGVVFLLLGVVLSPDYCEVIIYGLIGLLFIGYSLYTVLKRYKKKHKNK